MHTYIYVQDTVKIHAYTDIYLFILTHTYQG